MAITYTTGTFLPTATATVYTLFTDATGGAKKFRINTTNLPAGAILNLSFQALNASGGSYVERSNATLSNSVAVPAEISSKIKDRSNPPVLIGTVAELKRQ